MRPKTTLFFILPSLTLSDRPVCRKGLRRFHRPDKINLPVKKRRRSGERRRPNTLTS